MGDLQHSIFPVGNLGKGGTKQKTIFIYFITSIKIVYILSRHGRPRKMVNIASDANPYLPCAGRVLRAYFYTQSDLRGLACQRETAHKNLGTPTPAACKALTRCLQRSVCPAHAANTVAPSVRAPWATRRSTTCSIGGQSS